MNKKEEYSLNSKIKSKETDLLFKAILQLKNEDRRQLL